MRRPRTGLGLYKHQGNVSDKVEQAVAQRALEHESVQNNRAKDATLLLVRNGRLPLVVALDELFQGVMMRLCLQQRWQALREHIG